MKFNIVLVLRHFEERVSNADPMPPEEKNVLKKLADLYEWELVKGESRKALKDLAKLRDNGLF